MVYSCLASLLKSQQKIQAKNLSIILRDLGRTLHPPRGFGETLEKLMSKAKLGLRHFATSKKYRQLRTKHMHWYLANTGPQTGWNSCAVMVPNDLGGISLGACIALQMPISLPVLSHTHKHYIVKRLMN